MICSEVTMATDPSYQDPADRPGFSDLPDDAHAQIMGNLSRQDRALLFGVNHDMQENMEDKEYVEIGSMVNCFDREDGKGASQEKQKCLKYFRDKPVDAFEDLINSVKTINRTAERTGLGYKLQRRMVVVVPFREDPEVSLMAYSPWKDIFSRETGRVIGHLPELLVVTKGTGVTICMGYKLGMRNQHGVAADPNALVDGWTFQEAKEAFQTLIKQSDEHSLLFGWYDPLPIDFRGEQARNLFPSLVYDRWQEEDDDRREGYMDISVENPDARAIAQFLIDFQRVSSTQDLEFHLVTSPSDLWAFRHRPEEKGNPNPDLKKGLMDPEKVERLFLGIPFQLVTFSHRDDRWQHFDPDSLKLLSGSGSWRLKTAAILGRNAQNEIEFRDEFYLESPPLMFSEPLQP